LSATDIEVVAQVSPSGSYRLSSYQLFVDSAAFTRNYIPPVIFLAQPV